MEQVRIEIKIKNKVLYDAIYKDSKNISFFCKKYSLNLTRVCEFISLKKSPINKTTGEFNKLAVQLSFILKIPFEILFPKNLYKIKKTFFVIEKEVNVMGFNKNLMIENANPETHVFRKELNEALMNVLSKLKQIEKNVIIMRYFEDKTLEEIGKKYNLNRNRIRQIESKALNKIRNPKLSKNIKHFLDYK